MKKLISVIIASVGLAVIVPSVLASEHGAHCSYQATGKLSKCQVLIDTNNKTLAIEFKSDDEQDGNLTINGHQITELSTGEYGQTRVKESIARGILSGPMAGIINLIDPQKRRQFVVEYNDAQGKKILTMIDIPQQYSLILQQELQLISGISVKSSASGN